MTDFQDYASLFANIQMIRRRLFDELGYGLALEGLAAIALSH